MTLFSTSTGYFDTLHCIGVCERFWSNWWSWCNWSICEMDDIAMCKYWPPDRKWLDCWTCKNVAIKQSREIFPNVSLETCLGESCTPKLSRPCMSCNRNQEDLRTISEKWKNEMYTIPPCSLTMSLTVSDIHQCTSHIRIHNVNCPHALDHADNHNCVQPRIGGL